MNRSGARVGLLLALALASGPAFGIGPGSKAPSDADVVAQSTAPSKTVPKAAPHLVAIDGFAFKPPTITVKQGETIEWRNDDPVPHTATAKAAGLDSGSIAAGATYRFVAKKKGRFDYICTFHPIMKGEIVVE